MSFSLHKLPVKAVLHVLRRMEIYDQLAYSLCSKSTKKVVKSLGLRARRIELCVTDDIEISIYFNNSNSIFFSSFFSYSHYVSNEEYSIPWHIKVYASNDNNERISWKWSFSNIGIREYLHHFTDVLQQPKIDELFLNSEFVNADFVVPVQKVLEGLQILEFSPAELLTNEFSRIALESFYHYDQLYLKRIPFERHELGRMNKIFMKNLWRVCIVDDADMITIDQLLISNWEETQLVDTHFTDKDFHVFLKLWMSGSNPRLKYFDASTFFPLDRNVILKGIKYSKIPLGSKEVHRRKIDVHYQETQLAGGRKIKRFDGTTAVVVIKEYDFKLIVDI